ncbi:hypothetical protein BC828DRAFT_373033 [Blastocladiella britannica]|nr:hypothetical protein BC828DRAFT_373033 [Blastocladiella britannica]
MAAVPDLSAPIAFRRKRVRADDDNDTNDAQHPIFPTLLSGAEPAFLAAARRAAYLRDRDALTAAFAHAWDSAHAACIDGVLDHVLSCARNLSADNANDDEDVQGVLPAAIVAAGVNVADQARAFSLLAGRLAMSTHDNDDQEEPGPRIAVAALSSADFSSMRTVVRAIVARVTDTPHDDLDHLATAAHPAGDGALVVVLLVSDFDAADPVVASRLVQALVEPPEPNTPVTRYVLVVGTSHPPAAVGSSSGSGGGVGALHPAAQRVLQSRVFRLEVGRAALDAALCALFLPEPLPLDREHLETEAISGARFRLTAGVLDWVRARFDQVTHSGADAARTVVYAALDHYYGTPTTGLAAYCEDQEALITDLARIPTNHPLWDVVRALPTVRTWVNHAAAALDDHDADSDNEPHKSSENGSGDSHPRSLRRQHTAATARSALQVLEDDDALRAKIPEWLAALDTGITRHAFAVRLVHDLQAQVAKLTSRGLSALYVVALEQNLAAASIEGGAGLEHDDDPGHVRLFLALIQKSATFATPDVAARDALRILAAVTRWLAPEFDGLTAGAYASHVAELEQLLQEAETPLVKDGGDSVPDDDPIDEEVGDDDEEVDGDEGDDLGARLRTTLREAVAEGQHQASKLISGAARARRARSSTAVATSTTTANNTAGISQSSTRLALAVLDRQVSDRTAWHAANLALGKSHFEQEQSKIGAKLTTRTTVAIERMCAWLQLLLAEWLVPPSTRPLAEVRFHARVAALEKGFNVPSGPLVKAALARPDLLLGSVVAPTVDVSGTASIDPSDPDTCILYKLHLESGRLLNLHDWYSAFRALISRAPGYDVDRNNDAESDVGPDFVRFIRGVNELQLLGFVKPTTRKTDHVQRLTWGKV